MSEYICYFTLFFISYKSRRKYFYAIVLYIKLHEKYLSKLNLYKFVVKILIFYIDLVIVDPI